MIGNLLKSQMNGIAGPGKPDSESGDYDEDRRFF